MPGSDRYLQFLHHTHIFASMVRDILESKYLRDATELDLTVAQFHLLRLIAHNGSHQVNEIASFLGVSQAAASKNVDKLVRLQLVSRDVQKKDRRAASLTLTSLGESIIQEYEELKEERLKTLIDRNFTADELDGLIRGLEKISHLVLEKEITDNTCMKCSAYYVEHCLLESQQGGCLYHQSRKCDWALAVPTAEVKSG